MAKIFKVGLIGCGHIAETYFRSHLYFNNFKIVKCADINHDAAIKCANENKILAVRIEELLNDKDIDIILNLTIPKAHFEVSKKALDANKHCYSEKPMCTKLKDGKTLLELANKKKLYLGNAPDTFLGGGIQKSRELIENKIIGNIRLGNAIFAFPGVKSYHPNPESWFDEEAGGPVIDMGPYYITALVNLLGPVKKVQSLSTKVFETRTIGIGPKIGKEFKVNCPTTYLFNLEFHSEAIIQVTLSFDVQNHQRNHIELYGDKGSMIVPDPNMFGGSVFISKEYMGSWEEHKTDGLELGKINITNKSGRLNEASSNANYRGAGLAEMAYSIEKGIKHRCNAELSLHVLDIIESTMNSSKNNTAEMIRTNCEKPKIYTQQEIKKILI